MQITYLLLITKFIKGKSHPEKMLKLNGSEQNLYEYGQIKDNLV